MQDEKNPFAFSLTDSKSFCHDGMTLRDYFAAKCLASLIVNPKDYSDVKDSESAAKLAYDMADAMLNERLKTK